MNAPRDLDDPAGRLPSRLFHLWLESQVSEDQDHVRVVDLSHLVSREVRVVRLDARRREVEHMDLGPTDLLRRPGQRVEGPHDLELAGPRPDGSSASHEHGR